MPTTISRVCRHCGKSFQIRKASLSAKSQNKGLYCSPRCSNQRRAKSLRQRFCERLGKPTNGCLPWVGTFQKNGYGSIRLGPKGSKTLKAHRVSWELFIGPVPDGMCVLHECDNRWCVSPSCLFLGTNDDNMADMVAKGRQCRGEHVNTAKITPDIVRAIRADRAAGIMPTPLSRKYGLHLTNIHRIIRRETWKHID